MKHYTIWIQAHKKQEHFMHKNEGTKITQITESFDGGSCRFLSHFILLCISTVLLKR